MIYEILLKRKAKKKNKIEKLVKKKKKNISNVSDLVTVRGRKKNKNE